MNSRPATGCGRCRDVAALEFSFSMAFQPIYDFSAAEVWGWEALVRGPKGESAFSVLSQVTDENRYAFDQQCRIRAIELAHGLGMPGRLSINILPNAVYEPKACIRATVDAAARVGFPLDRLQFEITEVEQVRADDHLRRIVDEYREMGMSTAVDDFGAGYAGLNLLVRMRPDVLKLDMELIRNIDKDRVRKLIVAHMVSLARELPCTLIAEGVETIDEARCLLDIGIALHQGYLYARPAFEALPEPDAAVLASLAGA
ncbi:EAL domain-containing protein [Azoarcus sp. L1K30]|uniref:EAL domain-containing protein n=1 Tax=Azoarcus sp. L1K30 TaxID=2820277 RepID=UPI002011C804|nr:EAL domain-containing protein [Azoarcus sp. L1K30]